MITEPGRSISGFTLKKHVRIEEISSDVYLFEHEHLGCPLFAIKNNDNNKTFSISFNTIPSDSTGVAHILEHSVLMGSRKYPVKDVFGEMNKGGLMTFLNAMTGSDITYYPFATRNIKEYFNLMDVYCDVVFNPLLQPETFEQEGWHYHQEGPEKPLQFQGVVFNEMKGAFSDPIRALFQNLFSGLMPGSTYAHESGGDPNTIPELTYEQFCAFHKTHYHPSNATVFLYGDAPIEEELSFLHERFLADFASRGKRMVANPGTLIKAPQLVRDRYGIESADTAERTYLAVGTLVGTVADREKNASFQIIANILYNSDASPLKNRIVSSGICKDFGGLYLSTSCFNTAMVTYLVGSEPHHCDTFASLYRDTLREMVTDGLDRELVLAELNKYEFSVREDASKAQRGLDLHGKVQVAFKYGTDPFDALQNEELLRTIRKKGLHEHYFEDLIKHSLLDNRATVTVVLEPDPQKIEKAAAHEKAELAAFEAGLDDKKRRALIDRTRELIDRQQTPNDEATLGLLPQLSRNDLPTEIDFNTARQECMFDQEVLVSELDTNRITYLDIGLDLGGLPHRFLPLLDLFGAIITEIGTERLNYMAFAKEVAICTGGLSHSINTHTRLADRNAVRRILWLSLKALPEYLDRAIDLLTELFTRPRLNDRTRIKEIIRREFAWAEHGAQSEGYSLPATRVFAHLSLAGRYQEQFNGITAYRAAKELVSEYAAREEALLQYLQEMAAIILNRNRLIIGLTADSGEIDHFRDIGRRIPEALSSAEHDPVPPLDKPDFPPHEAFITAAEIVFAVQGGVLFPTGEHYHGSFEVLKTYLSRDYLWNTVRQVGGAYGCFIQFSHISGNIALVSYRDPQVRQTFEVYNRLPRVISEISLSTPALEQLIIGTYGAFDPHQSAAARGATARNDFLSGVTSEQKQQRLREITATTQDDLRSFCDRFADMTSRAHRAVIGNRTKIEADRDLFDLVTDL